MENNIQESWKDDGGLLLKCINDISKNSHYIIESSLSCYGLSTIQSRIMGYIYIKQKKGFQVHQKDIESNFRIKKSSVTSVIQLLERKGYLIRQYEVSDARFKKLILTDSGIDIVSKGLEQLHIIEKRIKELFTEEELDCFFRYMIRIDNEISEIYKERK